MALAWGVGRLISPYQGNHSRSSQTAFYSTNEPRSDVVRAVVISVDHATANLKIKDGPRAGNMVEVLLTTVIPETGQTVLLPVDTSGNLLHNISTHWRLPGVLMAFFGFMFVVFWVVGKRGLSSLAGLIVSVIIIAFVLIPAILGGAHSPSICSTCWPAKQ